jgi:hypothetical protein
VASQDCLFQVNALYCGPQSSTWYHDKQAQATGDQKIHQKPDQIPLSFSQAAKLMLTCLLEKYRGHNQVEAGAKSAETNLYIQLT